uniref:DUF4469 domain-containing protein n=1 Tax=Candidatus Kentrum sp. DK TaxID=2126562 RepID=A0A450THS9_9GAMM|nr:MAG: protein of unknown function (DUF4469) with IG-like fold [Candidatus Kentron sp. DK]
MGLRRSPHPAFRSFQTSPFTLQTSFDGYRLKFDPAKADEGIFLVPAETGGGKEARITQVQKNKPGQLIFLNPPNVKKGDYHLEVRARMRDSGEIRIGRLDAILTV